MKEYRSVLCGGSENTHTFGYSLPIGVVITCTHPDVQ